MYKYKFSQDKNHFLVLNNKMGKNRKNKQKNCKSRLSLMVNLFVLTPGKSSFVSLYICADLFFLVFLLCCIDERIAIKKKSYSCLLQIACLQVFPR